MGDGSQHANFQIHPELSRPAQWVALVVEDDDDQRDLIGAILEESDVLVITCQSAEAAMQVMERVGDRAVFVMTDVELAGKMDGVDLARELGVPRNKLYKWREELQAKDSDTAFPGSGRRSGKEAELAVLRRENERLREENAILKKAAQYFARESS